MNTKRHFLRIAGLCLLAMAGAVAAQAQGDAYPSKPVRIISDSAPGSTPDVVLRLVADRLSQLWGQQVIAVNQPGASGSIAARAASESTPDGYTLFMPVLSTFASLPGSAPNLPVQVPRDFIPIGFVAENPMFISVPPALGINTLPELLARAKARPGEISCAVTGVGRLTHLTAELLQMRTGIKLLIVPYTTGGPAQAFADVVSGRVHFIIEGFSGIAGAVQSGKIKPIAVAAPQRLPEFPDVPTVSETTTQDFTATGWQILVAPLGTPEAIIRKVSEDLRKVVTDPDLKKRIATRGSYTRAMTPEEAVAFAQAEQRKWLPVVQHIATKPR